MDLEPPRSAAASQRITRLFVALLAGHALADGPLQPRRVSYAKWGSPLPGGPSRAQATMFHAGCHGLAVAAVTRRPLLGLAEALVHAAVDESKCRGRLSTAQDQAIHVGFQLLWAYAATRQPARTRRPGPRVLDRPTGACHARR